MQSREVVATRLRPRMATVPAGAVGLWFAASGQEPSGAVFVGLLFGFFGILFIIGLPPETFQEAVAAGAARRHANGNGFAFGWFAPALAWFGVASAVVGAVRLVLG
ncbi:MAG: hypothetical protein JWO68_3180 [Actinomycetia bacterium]|nr:hypothetical protein [Actinomycetes bacterium]